MRGVYGCKEFLGFEVSLKFEEFLGFEESLESNDRGGGGSPALCRCRTGQLAAMKAAKCGMFSAYLRHNFRPVTHCGMVVKR